MSNVHGLFSNRDDNDGTNNRYVGGVSARGGGSGLAVEPTPEESNSDPSSASNLLSTIRSNASQPSPADEDASPPSRIITLYRSGFTIDNGPLRRLDDPSNAEFLRDLAKGIVPKELQADDQGEDQGGRTVGLVDKRHLEHDDDDDDSPPSSGAAAAAAGLASFTGEGQSLGGSGPSVSGGIVSPPSEEQQQQQHQPMVDTEKPVTVIQVRLLNGKKLKVKINVDAAVKDLVSFVNASGDAGQEDYVLSAGFPPKILEDLEKTVGEMGLQGSQVIQKKA